MVILKSVGVRDNVALNNQEMGSKRVVKLGARAAAGAGESSKKILFIRRISPFSIALQSTMKILVNMVAPHPQTR